MYKLTKKFFSSSVLIASIFNGELAYAAETKTDNESNYQAEQLQSIFPLSQKDINTLHEGTDYKETPPAAGDFAPIITFDHGSGPLYSISNSIFFTQKNTMKYINIENELSFNQQGLKNLTNLQGLSITTRNIDRNTPLHLPTNLEYARIRSPITIIDGKLNHLRYLYLSNEEIEKIPCLSTMSNLEYFEATHTGLKVLHLGDTPAPKLSEIRFIYNKQFKGILDITQFKNLEKAFLRGQTPIAPVDISTLTKLNRLVLDTPLTDKGIVLPTNLVHLDYTCQNCSQTPDISQLKNLTYARFSGPEFTSLPNIPAPEKLEELHLENTSITNIQGLEKFTNLQKLSINTSKISKIENLEQLPQLTHLSLSGNQISKIENIKKLVNLDTLNLEENPITTVDFTEFDHLGGTLIKLYGTPYDDTMSTDDYRKFSKLARQKRTPEKSQ